jgi:hypothetical protein
VITIRTGVPELLPVIVRFDDIRVYGAAGNSTPFATDLPLRGRAMGKFDVSILPGSKQTGQFKIPIVLMPAGEPESFQKRYDIVATPQDLAKKVRICLDMVSDGIAEGVVPYRTPLVPSDLYFDAVKREFAAFRAAPAKR